MRIKVINLNEIGERGYYVAGKKIVIPSGKIEHILDTETADAVMKDKEVLDAMKLHHKVVFLDMPHSEIINTPVETPAPADNKSDDAIPSSVANMTVRQAAPLISQCKTEEELRPYLDSPSKTISETAQRKLISLKNKELMK